MNTRKPLTGGTALLVVLAVSVFSGVGCSSLHGPGGGHRSPIDDRVNITGPKRDITIDFAADGSVMAIDNKTKKIFQICAPCPEELERKEGKKCKDIEKNEKGVPICSALKSKSIGGIQNITIIDSHASPGCQVITINGHEREVCR